MYLCLKLCVEANKKSHYSDATVVLTPLPAPDKSILPEGATLINSVGNINITTGDDKALKELTKGKELYMILVSAEEVEDDEFDEFYDSVESIHSGIQEEIDENSSTPITQTETPDIDSSDVTDSVN